MTKRKIHFAGIDAESAYSIFNSAPTPYLVLSPDFTIIDANEARLIATDTTREDTIGHNIFEAFPDNPADVNATGVKNLKHSLETVLKTKSSHKMDIQKYDISVHTPAGLQFEERYWCPVNFPVFNSDGTIKYIIHQVDDVTEEVKSKNNLKNIEAVAKAIETERFRLFSIFNQAPIGICLAQGPDLIIEYANKMFRKISGEKRKLDDLPITKAFEDFAPEILDHTYKTFESGKTKIMEDLRVTTDWDYKGEPFEKIFFMIWQPLIGQNGKPEGVITLAYDDTEKIRARLETRNTLEILHQEQELRERFVATLSHDLRTPLTAASMSAQLLRRRPEDADSVRRFCEKILNALERCDQMILNLLDANRIKAGELIHIDLELCSLKQIAQETIEELSTVHGDRFTLNSLSGPVNGEWSITGIKRILENLCNNAIKYGSKQTKVTISIQEFAENVLIEVQNWGNPISAEDQEHLFDLYRRAGPSEDVKENGWGLGLTLVKGLTEAHKGSVSVTSTNEQGTIFKISLPKTNLKSAHNKQSA
jgi:signal transduction histidine kinase